MTLWSIWFVMQLNGIYQCWPNVLEICQCLLYMPLSLQAVVRFYTLIFRNDQSVNLELHQIAENFYEIHESNEKYASVLTSRIKSIRFWIFTLSSIYLFIYVIQTPVAIAFSFYTDDYVFFTPNYLPLIEPRTPFGFVVNSVFHSCVTVVAFSVFIVLDYMFFLYGFQVIPMVDITIMKIEELGDEINDQKSTKEKFIKLIQEIERYNEYICKIVYFMKFPCFASLILDSIAICLCILVSLSNSSTLALASLSFAGAVGFFFQVISPCIIGTVISHQNARITMQLEAFPWYEMSRSEQKTFLQLIHYCQNLKKLSMPILGNVDMALFTHIVNTSYSMFNFILNFVHN